MIIISDMRNKTSSVVIASSRSLANCPVCDESLEFIHSSNDLKSKNKRYHQICCFNIGLDGKKLYQPITFINITQYKIYNTNP